MIDELAGEGSQQCLLELHVILGSNRQLLNDFGKGLTFGIANPMTFLSGGFLTKICLSATPRFDRCFWLAHEMMNRHAGP
jgi:hypothetical protein